MNIILMNLPELTIGNNKTVVPPLGMQYLASNIRGKHKVLFIDQKLFKEKPLIKDGDLSIWGLSMDELKSYIISSQAEVIAISCIFTYQHEYLVETLNLIKTFFPHIKTIAGGNHITAYHKYYPKLKDLDAYILGEGEEAFNLFLEGKLDETKTYHIENLDTLKFPNRVYMEEYFKENCAHDTGRVEGARVVPMITSRGCPYNCIFCSVKNIWGRGIRLRSAENVIAEVAEIVEKYKPTEIHFEDDNLTHDKERMLKICEGMKKFNLKWTCPNGVEMRSLDRELLKAMWESGCYRITICPESFNDRILKFYRKPFNEKIIEEKIKLIREFPFELVGYFIIGAPDETYEEVRKTLKLAVNEFDSFDISYLSAYPGTDFWDYCIEKDLLVHKGFINARSDYSGVIKRALHPDILSELAINARTLHNQGGKME